MGPRAPKCNSCDECSMRTQGFRSIPAGDMLHDGMRKLHVERYRLLQAYRQKQRYILPPV